MDQAIPDVIQNVVRIAREPLMVLDQDHNVVAISDAFAAQFLNVGNAFSSLSNSPVRFSQLENGLWNIAALGEAIQAVSAGAAPIHDLAITQILPDRTRSLLVNISAMGVGEFILLAIAEQSAQPTNSSAEPDKAPKAPAATVHRQHQELQLANRALSALAHQLEVSVVIQTIVEAFAEIFGYTQVSLYLIEGDRLRLQHQVGYDTVIEEMSLTRGIIGKVARSAQPVLLVDVHEDPAFLAAIEGIVSEISVPLMDDGKVVGVFTVESTNGVVFTEADLTLVLSLSEYVNIAIGRARLYAALRESHDHYAALVNNLRDVIFQADRAGKLTFLNTAWVELYGYPIGESLGTSLLNYIVSEDRPAADELLQQVIEKQPTLAQQEIRLSTSDGRVRWVECRTRPTLDSRGEVIGFSGTLTDTTDRHHANEARAEASRQLAASQDAIERLLQQAPHAIVIFDPTGLCTKANPAILRLFGLENAQVMENQYNIFNDPVAEQLGVATVARRALAGEVVTLRDFRFDSPASAENIATLASWLPDSSRQQRVTNTIVFPVYDANQQVTSIVAILSDITDQVQVEEALRYTDASEREQRAVATALGETAAIISSSLDLGQVLRRVVETVGRVVPHDSASIMLIDGEVAWMAYRTNGPNNAQHYDQGADTIFPATPGDMHESGGMLPLSTPTLQKMFNTQQPCVISDVSTFTDWVMPAEIGSYAAAPLRLRGQVIGFLNLDSRTPHGFQSVHGGRLQAFADQAAVAIENARLYQAIRRHAADLERRVAERTTELNNANVRLQELDRLKSKFITNASHELRTPVANLALRVHLLEKDVPEKQPEHINNLKNQIFRLKELVDNILDFSQLEMADPASITVSTVLLNDLVQSVVVACLPRAELAGLGLLFEADPDLPGIQGNATYLSQMVTNLVINAINYTPSGNVTVSTEYDAAGSRVCLKVKDSGIGIDSKDLPHLFERFYRGRRHGASNIAGTGLGLSIVSEIVQRHGVPSGWIASLG